MPTALDTQQAEREREGIRGRERGREERMGVA